MDIVPLNVHLQKSNAQVKQILVIAALQRKFVDLQRKISTASFAMSTLPRTIAPSIVMSKTERSCVQAMKMS